ncbi:MAG: acetyltransferase [Flavobacterium sp.]|nr:MAG: acetyltransferase [Flavobacterium sp.]
MSDKELILIGYSGHGFVVSEAALLADMDLRYYSEIKELKTNPFDLKYIGFEGDDFFQGWDEQYDFILGIGDNRIREKIANLITARNKVIYNVIHHSASISQKVVLGSGNFIARKVSINPLVTIGDFCILNTGCIIEHECTIGNSVHIAPGAVLAGNVSIGDRTFVGANAVIKQGIEIGKDVIIGAGSVIIKNIPDGKKIVGNPSREI